MNSRLSLSRTTNSTPTMGPQNMKPLNVVNVWKDNFDEQMNLLMAKLEEYPYIAMDTEFPGVDMKGNDSLNIFEYDIIKRSVDRQKIIQLGITLCDKDGQIAEDVPTWQFNFQFDDQNDLCNTDSMNLLRSASFNFEQHRHDGIKQTLFAEVLTMSGLVLNPNVKWISFHGDYDFAYLLSILTGSDLPDTKKEFDVILHIYFPHLFDVKYIYYQVNSISIGLNKLAEQLQIPRLGIMHQSGSDSRLTAETFFCVRKMYASDHPESEYDGYLYGALDVRK